VKRFEEYTQHFEIYLSGIAKSRDYILKGYHGNRVLAESEPLCIVILLLFTLKFSNSKTVGTPYRIKKKRRMQ